MNLRDKVALVTGGAHRVGKAVVLRLAQAGAHVVINYHNSADDARKTLHEVEALGVRGLTVQADVGRLADVQRMASAIETEFGGVDVIVNSASLFKQTPFPTDDLSGWQQVTAISIDGPFYVCNALVPRMQARGGGAIINIVDLSAWEAWPNFTAHSVGKAGLLALTRQLALELAPTIRVNAVAPGPVLPPPEQSADRTDKTAQRTLLERWGAPEDVAQAVHYLLEADYVTAEVLRVDGGEHYGYRKRKVS